MTIDGATVDSDLDGQEATNYIELNSGQHRVVIEAPAGTIQDRQITLDGNAFVSLVIVTDSGSFLDPSTQQVGTNLDLLQLQDDVVTEPLRLQLRLVNAFPALSNATLSTRAGVVLGGPVRENSAGPYTELNPQEVGPVTGAIAVVNDLVEQSSKGANSWMPEWTRSSPHKSFNRPAST